MSDCADFKILSFKELLDEQFLLENGKFRFQIISPKKTNQILSRALHRKKVEGWRLCGIDSKFFTLTGSHYIFEKSR